LLHRAEQEEQHIKWNAVKEETGKKNSKCSERGNWLPDACCHSSSRIIRFNYESKACYAKCVLCLSLVYRMLLCKDTVIVIICVLGKTVLEHWFIYA
jgi:hypothetical protein